MAGTVLKTDKFLILGDFNVHVCCESKPLVKDFLTVIESLNLTQWVTGATHEKGHTLDLVLSHGLDVSIDEICCTSLSDHMPIVFTFSMPCSLFKPCALTRPQCVLNPQTEATFSVAFKTAMPVFMNACVSCDLSANNFG